MGCWKRWLMLFHYLCTLILLPVEHGRNGNLASSRVYMYMYIYIHTWRRQVSVFQRGIERDVTWCFCRAVISVLTRPEDWKEVEE